MSEAPQTPQVAPRFERDPAFVDTYANQLRMNANLADFTLIFGVNDDVGRDQFQVRDRVAVHLPPSVAKTLLAQLQAMIESYEEVIAPIPVPHNLDAHLDAIKTQMKAGLGQAVHGKTLQK